MCCGGGDRRDKTLVRITYCVIRTFVITCLFCGGGGGATGGVAYLLENNRTKPYANTISILISFNTQ